MARKQTSKNRSSDEPNPEVEGNVDKIRQILFGGQMRDYEERFDAMEKRLTQAVNRASGEFERRMDRLDTYVRREMEKIGEQITAERKDRSADDKKAVVELKSLIDHVETWFAEVDEQITGEVNGLRQAILDNSAEQVGREEMAALLAEVATRLGKDLKRPKR